MQSWTNVFVQIQNPPPLGVSLNENVDLMCDLLKDYGNPLPQDSSNEACPCRAKFVYSVVIS